MKRFLDLADFSRDQIVELLALAQLPTMSPALLMSVAVQLVNPLAAESAVSVPPLYSKPNDHDWLTGSMKVPTNTPEALIACPDVLPTS